MAREITADIVILGAGPGGGAAAYALKDSGADVLLVERGGFLPIEPADPGSGCMHCGKPGIDVAHWARAY